MRETNATAIVYAFGMHVHWKHVHNKTCHTIL